MIEGQYESAGRQQCIRMQQHSRLLQQHPVLIPVSLLGGSVGLCVTSFFADTLFPVLALLGLPAALLCMSVALALGISGLLTSIISILESIDRHRLQDAMFPKPKEQSYANCN